MSARQDRPPTRTSTRPPHPPCPAPCPYSTPGGWPSSTQKSDEGRRMRTIDSAMQTIINGHTKRPAISMSIEDHNEHLVQYENPNVGDGWNDWCLTGDNAIMRCYVDRVSGTSAFTRTFYYQKVTDPTVASQWSTWTEFPSAHHIIFQDG